MSSNPLNEALLLAFARLEGNPDFATVMQQLEGMRKAAAVDMRDSIKPALIFRAQGAVIVLDQVAELAANARHILDERRAKQGGLPTGARW